MVDNPIVGAEAIKSIGFYAALAVPGTAAITSFAKVVLEAIRQRHLISSSQIAQTHEITTTYLNRALDAKVPLAIRYQLLRFLATPDNKGNRLSAWASAELERSEFEVVESSNKAVIEAEKAKLAAKTATELADAEKQFMEAMHKRRILFDAPLSLPVTAQALRAGLISDQNLTGLKMRDVDLSGVHFFRRDLKGADFSGSNLSNSDFEGSDLRLSKFNGANMKDAWFYLADLRGAEFKNAKFSRNRWKQARLEGADFTDAEFEGEIDLKATYDDRTKWPKGFDPVMAGGVYAETASTEVEVAPAR